MPLFEIILVFLSAGLLGIALARGLRLSPIVGFFIVGAAIGEHGFGLVHHSDAVELMGELGVSFLLFDIGIHLSFRKLWASRAELLGLGLGQTVTTTAVIGTLGWLSGTDLLTAFVLGAGLSLSSTAVVLKVVKDRNEEGSPLGRSAVSLLVFQDLAVVFLLVLLPAVVADADGLALSLGSALLRILLALAAVIALGRYLLQPLFRWIVRAQNDELFTMAALMLVLSIAWGTGQLGLSLPLGAFLAGLALSESRFSYLVRSELAPFRGLLLSLFFISVGMSLAVELLFSRTLLILGLTAALILVKSAILAGVALALQNARGFSVNFGMLLAQGSEFTFVLFGQAGAELGILDAELRDLMVAVVGISMALTPLLAALGGRMGRRLEKAAETPASAASIAGKVVLVGFDETAKDLARILVAANVKYVAMTSDRDLVASGRCQGFEVEFANPDRPKAIAMASVGGVSHMVLMPAADHVTRTVIEAAQKMGERFPIFAATADYAFYRELVQTDIRDALIKNDNTPFEIGKQILADLKRSDAEIDALLKEVRARAETPAIVETVG